MAFHVAKENKTVSLSAVFVDKYMNRADGNFVKVYIMGLRQCNARRHLTDAEIANALGMLESDVLRAWRYWENMGLVQLKKRADGETEIIFRDPESLEAKPRAAETKPVYSVDEIYARVRGDRAMEDLYSIASRILEKPLSTPDTMIIYSLFDYYRFPLDVIPLLLTYCMSENKKSMRQIERTAQQWVDMGIDSVEKAEAYLKKAETYSRKIADLRKALGIYDRSFTQTEMKYINMWVEQLGISVELIAYAYDIAVVNTGKLAIKYMNTILQDWHAKGIKTPAQASEYRRAHKKEAQPQQTAKTTKFSNFKQPEFNYDALEERAFNKRKG